MKNLIISSLLFSFVFFINSLTAQCVEGDCINGKGVYIVKNEMIFTGYFSNGEPSGKGIIHFKNGSRLYARWHNGMPEGKSIFVDSNGFKLYHIIKSNQIQGISIFKDPQGYIAAGLLWRDSEIVDIVLPIAPKPERENYKFL
ncbi:MAG: hypothetical protein EA412_03670 [Chitinophagaceae bacterium]|nr:MAG: hypothetical protein EA412_03670 [Chitinophagaceae bacterium]